MSGRFHFNPYSGDVNPCRAQEDCPFGSERHGNTQEEAQKLYEESMHSFLTPTLSKTQTETSMKNMFPPGSKLQVESQEREQVLLSRFEKGEPLNTREFKEHKEYVDRVTSKLVDMGYSTDRIYAKNHFGDTTIYTDERVEEQNKVVNHFLEKYKDVPAEKKALFAGGLGGAGKSTALEASGEFDQSQYATINPDDVKEEMARRGMIPRVPGTTPMDVSTLAHEEASDISDRIARRMINEDKNVLYDVTMGSYGSAKKKIERLKNSDYEVESMFVDIEPDESKRRGEYRYQTATNNWVTTNRGSGGRPLPAHVVDSQRTDTPGVRSKNAENIIRLVHDGVFDKVPVVFDNMGKNPVKLKFQDFARGYTYRNVP